VKAWKEEEKPMGKKGTVDIVFKSVPESGKKYHKKYQGKK
jgi:hypothetical protein